MLLTIDKLISRLEYILKRELGGWLLGAQRQNRLGDGSDIRDYRGYEPGDPMRDIDHKQSAKSGSWQVRQYDAELSQDIWLLIDTRRSMRIGAGPASKFNHALHLSAMAYVWVRSVATRFGAIQLGSDEARVRPVRQGHDHSFETFEWLRRSTAPETIPMHLELELEQKLHQLSRRSIVIVATCTSDQAVLEPLRKHGGRHEIFFINVRDAVDDMTINPSGWTAITDVDAGIQRSGYVSRLTVQKERERRATELKDFETQIKRLPVKYLRVRTTENPLRAFIKFARSFKHQERRRSA